MPPVPLLCKERGGSCIERGSPGQGLGHALCRLFPSFVRRGEGR